MESVVVKRCIEDRFAFKNSTELIALSGASDILASPFMANAVSDNALTIKIDPSSVFSVVDPNLNLHMQFSIAVNGTNTSTEPLCISSMFAPSFFPIKEIISAHNIKLNDAVCSLQSCNLYDPIITNAYDGDLNGPINSEFSMTPCMPDYSQEFLTLPESATSIRNPLSEVYDQTLTVPRSSFPGWQTVDNAPGATSAHFTLDCTEPITISPLAFGSGSFGDVGITAINNMTYQCSFGSLQRIVSCAYAPAVSGVPGSISYAPPSGGLCTINSITVHVTFAEVLTISSTIPDLLQPKGTTIRAYNDVIDFSTTQQTPLVPGGITTISSGTQTLSSVPLCCYIFVPSMPDSFTQATQPTGTTVSATTLPLAGGSNAAGTDFHPLQITCDDKVIASSYTCWDLYKICKKNGITSNWSEFMTMNQWPHSTGKGCVLKLFFSVDIPLRENVVVGETGKFSFNVKMTVFNNTTRTLNEVTLHTVMVYDGLCTISLNTQSNLLQSSFSREEIAAIPIDTSTAYGPPAKLYGGGSFWDKIKSLWNPISGLLKETRLLSSGAKLIPGIGSTLSTGLHAVGYGDGAAAQGRYRPMRRGGMVQE